MRAIVIGATGMTGSLLVQKLLRDDNFTHIKLITRRPTGLQDIKLEEIVIDFADEQVFKGAVRNADVLFCCIGTTQKKVKGDKNAYRKIDFDIQVNAASFCIANFINKFVLISTVGANSESSNFYLRLKGETEEAILRLPFESIHIMRPSMLLGSRKEQRLGETVGKGVMQLFSILLVGSLSKYKAINAVDVAEAMLIAAKKNNRGKFIYHYKEMMDLLAKKIN
jgi:uncharacterized protein YbjT (DUF2867 family)